MGPFTQASWSQVSRAAESSVFEIGNALREARERQGLQRADVERETRIRQRYLAALEDEHFELIPARAYAKGFLRLYADFLGLDGQRFVDEFNSRYPEREPLELGPLAPAGTGRRSSRRLTLVLVAVAAATVLGVLGWRLGSGHPTPASSPPPAARPTHAATPSPAVHVSRAAHRRTAHLLLVAQGPCWISARVGSETGPVLYEGTLADGQRLLYTLAPRRPRLWLRIGAPWNLRVQLNRRRLGPLPIGPGNVVVTAGGMSTA
jgi:transcriptional regulator with XRE-family HTH domain